MLALTLLAASSPGGRKLAVGRHAMVATEQHYATQAGVDVLRDGGNAVDAAVAVAYALAVVDPCCGNIGGGGFMLVRMHDGRERFIDFREKAPLRATRDMYLDAHGNVVPFRSTKGWLAVGVPGTVLGMETARKEFGTMSRAALMAPAIALARDGFVFEKGDLLPFDGSKTEGYSGAYGFSGQPNVRAIFMPHGAFPVPGTVLRQPQLARTLETIAAGGADAFYRGPIAKAVVAASERNGGLLTMRDFSGYTVDESAPVHCSYQGYEIASAPPPSSGGVTLCEILNVVAPYPLASWGWHSLQSLHYVTEAERRAYADRNSYLGDPAFVKDPVAQLLSPAYAAKLRASISPDRATPSVDVKPGLGTLAHENGETTHFSIVDRWGNAVGVTFTINDWFGAGIIAGDTGFFLNDEMDDFTSKAGVPNMFGLVQGERNDIEPGKRPLSSMTPTIVTKDGRLVMVTGSPGGSRIITIVLETILDALVYGMNAQQAVDAPRTHMQWLPDRIEYEPGAIAPAVATGLRAMGYALQEIPMWGSAQAVVVDPKTGIRYGGTDRRRLEGEALGY
ncbi:MAG TPA: gamma-glutamyltransferase [Verrucomicrobiae bacterium]|nr:gamma-glutamyltransferase [Verrucomicrobiae bacterium]